MKILILTRGAPGCGKSTFLAQNGLAQFVISPDLIREEIGIVEYDQKGDPQIGYFNEEDVWREVKHEIRNRMEKDVPIIVDATFQTPRHIEMPLRLAKQFKYQLLFVDFTNISKDLAKRQNAMRAGWRRVPVEIIDRAYANFQRYRIPDNGQVKKLTPTQFISSDIYKLLQSTSF